MSLPTKKYIANHEILCETEKDGMLLFNPESGEVKILNETGAFVFDLFKKGAECQTILQRLHDAFDDCDPAVVEADLAELVGQFEKSGLIYEIPQEASR